jgi:YVTN family beta-propeller protein
VVLSIPPNFLKKIPEALMKVQKFSMVVASLLLFALTAPLFALHVVDTVGLGQGVSAIAVNSKTNRIYVVNPVSGALSVIDGFTDLVVASIPVGQGSIALGINTITNRIYVLNETNSSVAVVDGNTNKVTTTITAVPGVSIAVNPYTNRIFVADMAANLVHVLSGSSNKIIADVSTTQPNGIVVNSATNLIYGTGNCSCGIFVIDGQTNMLLSPISLPGTPVLFRGLAVDERSNQLYVPSVLSGNSPVVSVVDAGTSTYLGSVPNVGMIFGIAALPGVGQAVTTGGVDPVHRTIVLSDTINFRVLRSLRVGRGPADAAYNSATGFIYVTATYDGTVSVISRN